jgi:zinc protease
MKFNHYTLGKLIRLLTIVILFPQFAFCQDAEKLVPDPSVATGKLKNGLTYYIRNNHKPENKVELRLVVKAGSILEENDQLGLAHFMEHMNFNGTKNFERNELVKYLQTIGVQFGADLNAYTAFDQTVYILPIPTDKPGNLEKGFQIIEDWAHNANLTDQDIDDERSVVLEESRLGKGADDRMLRKYFPKMMDGTKYAERLPIGKDEVIKKFKYDKLKDFYHDWYRPELEAVVVVGDIDTAKAIEMITNHFAGIKNPSPAKRRSYESLKPRHEPEAMIVTDKEATGYSLNLFYPYQKKHETTTPDEYKRDIIKNLGLTILNHRLNDLAQGANPPFTYGYAYFNNLVHGYENLSVSCGFGKEGVENSLNAITGELLRLKKFGFSQTELETAKKELMSGMESAYNERGTTDSKNYVEEYIRNFLDKEPFPGIEKEYSMYKTYIPGIQLNEVNTIAKNWVTSKNIFTLITGPEDPEVVLPKQSELLRMVTEGFSQQVKQVDEKKVPTSLINKMPAAGRVTKTEKEEGLDATTYTLSNDIKVTFKTTNFKTDEILLQGIKKGGTNLYDVDDRYNALFTCDAVESMGVGEFSPTDLEKMLAGKTLSVSTSMSDISDIVSGNSSVKDFESMMQVLYLYLSSPRRDDGLFKAFKTKQETSIHFMSANPKMAFIDTTIKTLYENDPLARVVIPKESDLEKIDINRVLEIYRDEFCGADGYHFFITGNINAETALPIIEKYLGSIPKHNKRAILKDNGVRPLSGNNKFELKKGTEKQSFIFEVYAGKAPYSEDFSMKVQALAEVLNIKVIEELREKMGSIYAGGFSGGATKEPYERFSIILQLPCGPENVDTLISASNLQIETIKENGPDAKDIEKVKSQWHEKHVTDLKENRYWNESLVNILFWGREKDRVIKFDDFIQTITTEDLKNTAKKVFNGNNQFLSILYPEK